MTNTKGQNWAFESDTIYIFDAAGKNLGKTWEINTTGVGASLFIHPTKFSAKLREAILLHQGDGAISVGAANAVLLFLEGIIKLEALSDSMESEGRILIKIFLTEKELETRPELLALQGLLLSITPSGL